MEVILLKIDKVTCNTKTRDNQCLIFDLRLSV